MTCAKTASPSPPDNALWQAQERMGKAIESSLKTYGDMRDRALETMFHAVYGSPLLQALVGLKASKPLHVTGLVSTPFTAPSLRSGSMSLHEKLREADPVKRRSGLSSISACLRASPTNAASACLSICAKTRGSGLSLADFKTMVRDQFFMLLLDERRAIEAMPAMLDADPELASAHGDELRKLIEVARRGKQARQEPLRRDDHYVRVEEGRQSSQKWCAEGGSHRASSRRASASGEAAPAPLNEGGEAETHRLSTRLKED